ncbi:hypothetical protein BG015_007989 [Linnemannia schmuckeri]|uniref:ABC transporter domain-containing protein n=1 Tax=Linnemannia schmuckeri TaxID=64567 RepID=A0A9P5S132_9FUNG|nr:hypothetical protein BG015_007989 [Linnemannia schmuckeri]
MASKKNQDQDISLASSQQDESPFQIPMEPITEKEIFEPLPEPIDFSNIKPTTLYQFRGMARRALSYHRRQRITNAGCLVVWPVLLVVLCHILNKTLGSIDRQGLIRYCTNEADPQFGRTFSLQVGGFMPEDNNVYNSPSYPAVFEPLGVGDFQQACVRWFGESYPVSPPYQNATWANTVLLDSTYIPSPEFGWFNVDKTISEYLKYLRMKQREFFKNPELYSELHFDLMPFSLINNFISINQTVYYSTANADIATTLGVTANVTRRFLSESWPPTDPNIILYNTSRIDPANGVLGAMPLRYTKGDEIVRFDNRSRVFMDAYTTGPTYLFFENREDVEGEIRALVKDEPRGYIDYRSRPFGGVHFDSLDVDKAKVSMTMQFGMSSYGHDSDMATPGLRQLIVTSQITNALARLKFKGQYIISQGIRALPYEFQWDRLNNRAAGLSATYLFPFALSFLLPNFVTILVQEKEGRHRILMAMNGLNSGAYYLAHYVEFFTMQLILTVFFVIAALVVKNDFLWNTSPGLTILLLLLWAHVQTTFSFFLASFFSKSRKASLFIYFLVALSVILACMSDMIFSEGPPFAWFIHPTFSFFYIVKVGMMHAGMINQLYPLTLSSFTSGPNLLNCVGMLLGESVLFLLLTFYIDAVMPSEYGVRRSWHFPVSSLFQYRLSTPSPTRDIESEMVHGGGHANLSVDSDQESMDGGDADVRAERERVRTKYNPDTTPLIIDNLYHRYADKVEAALKGMSFGVETNTVLGLLGPNGAGKSTLIHLLTGLYEPTRGSASVAGANIRTEMSLVHARMGVCPQHDILWNDLTVADHLLFYSRLRGVPPSMEQQSVDFAIASVSLTRLRDRQVKGLSGGEKRRVSIAIALLGDNRVVFLDEPSTGLDAEVRRVIWDIVNRVKVNRTVILTTHSMEEADILSDKIAIMTNGLLRCIGTSLHLKELYGSGFRLNITSKPGRLDEACQSIENKLMRKLGLPYRRSDKFTNASVFEFDVASNTDTRSAKHDAIVTRGELSSIFHYLSQSDLFPAVEDWGISQTTLEDVFIKIVTDADATLTVPDVIEDIEVN